MQRVWSLGFLCATVACFAEPVRGVTKDFEKAQLLSAVYERPLAYLFTGTDWSLESNAFQANILHHPNFSSAIGLNTLFLQVDFSGVGADGAEQKFALKEKYHVKAFPTIVLTDGKGVEITRLGYSTENLEVFSAKIRSALGTYRELQRESLREDLEQKEIEELYVRALDLGCNTLAQKMLDRCGKSKMLMEKYIALVSQGLIKSHEASVIRSTLDTSERALQAAVLEFQKASKFDITRASNTLAQMMEEHCDDENIWKLQMMLSEHFSEQEMWEESLYYAECSLRVAPEMEKERVLEKIAAIKLHRDGENSTLTP